MYLNYKQIKARKENKKVKLKNVIRNPAILANVIMTNGIFKKDDSVIYRCVEKEKKERK